MRKKVHNTLMKLKTKNWVIVTLNAIALITVVQNMNAGCMWLNHQPEVPEEAKRFRKF